MATAERPDVSERYECATNTSRLLLEEHRTGAADVLVAAGWSPATLGGAIMRLHTEAISGVRQACLTEAILAAMRMKTLRPVLAQMELRAVVWGMEDPVAKAKAVVLWWLSRVCPRCSGRRQEVILGTPTLSARNCKSCGGTGEVKLPYGEQGRRLATYMDDCVADWEGSMKRNLAHRRRARNKVVDTPNGRVIIAAGDGTGR